MTTFTKVAREQGSMTRTENGAVALKTTDSALLDLFSNVGAMRTKSEGDITSAFRLAFKEDNLLATKLMFYARNVRGGLKERDTFRYMLRDLAFNHPQIVIKNMELIPHFGRWDDLYSLIGTPVESKMWEFLRWKLKNDVSLLREGKPVSLCAKWMASINTSSKETVKLGKLTAKALDMTERDYRKMLSALRKQIDIPERKMSSKRYDEINYSAVPASAMRKHRNAFKKNDPVRFSEFIGKVKTGELKIKASTLFPYDFMLSGKLISEDNFWGRSRNSGFELPAWDDVLEEQWKAQPNYVKPGSNVLVMADTSASMQNNKGLPLATALGLSMYFAERNLGAYHNLFLTFSSTPQFVTLKGKTVSDRIKNIPEIVSDTNLEAAFDLILQVALENNVPQSEMPKSLVIISDMQFNSCVTDNRYANRTVYSYNQPRLNKTFYKSMKDKFSNAGYFMPSIVFWQVDARSEAIPVTKDENGVVLVSGHSTATFRNLLQNIGKNPYEFMLEVLNDPMYEMITI